MIFSCCLPVTHAMSISTKSFIPKTLKLWELTGHQCFNVIVPNTKKGAGLHLGGFDLSLTYTEMVHFLQHSCLSPGSEVHDL